MVVLRSLTKFLELVGYTPQMQIQPVPSPQAVLATRVALLNVCMLQGVARTQEVPHFNESSLANVYGFSFNILVIAAEIVHQVKGMGLYYSCTTDIVEFPESPRDREYQPW